MEMLPPRFRSYQTNAELRDTLNYLHGFMSCHSGISFYLERTAGEAQGKKVNYRLHDKTVLTIRILKDGFRCELYDPLKSIVSGVLYETGQQFQKKGWRNCRFSPTPSDLEEVKRLIRSCLDLNSI